MADTQSEADSKSNFPSPTFVGENPKKPQKKYPSFWKNLNEYFSEYSASTSLHGFQYLGDQRRSIIEK